jgi:hypothetical protein
MIPAKFLRVAPAAIAMLGLAAAPAASEEGMWTFDNFPVERMRTQMEWAPDQAWLNRVMVGTARIPGCSASNVSSQGLLLTNHHCIIVCVNTLSSADTNYLDAGFMARAREEELRCPNMAVQVLTGIEDVTERIEGATRDVAPESFVQTRDAEIARIEASCTNGAQRCEVVTLYDGGRYALHRFHRYDDVRLVFAPEHAMAAFGGEADNFNFPRYALDFAFLRLYENGAPAATPQHLSMRFTPLQDGEVTLVSGNPGQTDRTRSAAELAFQRDVDLPAQVASLGGLRQRLVAFSAQGPEQARIAASTLQTVENAYKGLEGRRAALADPSGFAHVTARETDLQARVRRNLAAVREIGDPWGEIARAETAYRAFFHRHQLLETRAAEGSFLFVWARDIVRGAAEREKPDADRLTRYSSARLSQIERGLGTARTVSPELEGVIFANWLDQVRQSTGPVTVRHVLGAETPDALAARLIQTRLIDPDYRMELWRGGAAAVAASDDPLIAFVRAWDGDARALRARYVAEVETPVERGQERIARARFRAFGLAQYPDTTFSPRLSYGRIEGWTESGAGAVPAFTHADGLYARATGTAPLALSQHWLDARARLDPQTIFNLASSHDLIAGSSGSPLLDREGRVVGVAFDGNVHSLGGEYFYDRALNRSISVSSTIIRAALADVYGMDALLGELQAR